MTEEYMINLFERVKGCYMATYSHCSSMSGCGDCKWDFDAKELVDALDLVIKQSKEKILDSA